MFLTSRFYRPLPSPLGDLSLLNLLAAEIGFEPTIGTERVTGAWHTACRLRSRKLLCGGPPWIRTRNVRRRRSYNPMVCRSPNDPHGSQISVSDFLYLAPGEGFEPPVKMLTASRLTSWLSWNITKSTTYLHFRGLTNPPNLKNRFFFLWAPGP